MRSLAELQEDAKAWSGRSMQDDDRDDASPGVYPEPMSHPAASRTRVADATMATQHGQFLGRWEPT